MFAEYFEAGGPVMYAILGVWVVVLAGVLDRLVYAFGRLGRWPLRRVERLRAAGELDQARRALLLERRTADRGLARIDAVSQIATSLGLFGTVLGIARSFFARGEGVLTGAPEVLASGLGTALFTTLAGLIVFLFGQAFLIAYGEWLQWCERHVAIELAEGEAR